jgi:hypothetical protein
MRVACASVRNCLLNWTICGVYLRDQLGQVLSPVKFRTKRSPAPFRPTTAMASCSLMEKTIRCPSGDHDG